VLIYHSFYKKRSLGVSRSSSAEVGVQELSPNISVLTADQHTSSHIFHLSSPFERRQLIFLVIHGRFQVAVEINSAPFRQAKSCSKTI
jgi:hypothetical protein